MLAAIAGISSICTFYTIYKRRLIFTADAMYSVISEIPFTGTKQSLMLPPVLCFSALRNKSTANKHVYCSLQLQGGTSSSHAMGISSKVSGGLMGFHFHPIDEYILLFTSNESSALFVIHMDNNITLVASCLVCY
ncbi:hypothetical protein WN944_008983 [Citrus x changshan-huyou]|uniref:Uncharacterized protein n=1 Tax=Citrus x changshan-huyou TaxID=2935761 RepID=A0AAP0MNX6_9ROSI